MMKRPMLWPCLGLILGILASTQLVISSSILLIAFCISLVLLCAAGMSHAGSRQKALMIFSVLSLFSSLGFWSAADKFAEIEMHSVLAKGARDEKSYWVGKILEPCQEKEEGAKYVVQALEMKQGEMIRPLQGKILLTVGGEGACAFSVGDVVQAYSKLKAPDSFRNRHGFDYVFYLKVQGITATSFVESKDHLVKRDAEFVYLQSRLAQMRQKAALSMDSVQNEEAQQMLKAMLLGNSQKLSKTLEDAFRKTGTTHLLVVSGLHLAMVMGLLYFFFRFLFSLYPPLLLRVSVRYWSYWTSLPFLIFYSLLVGLTPTVLRSLLCIMFVSLLILHKRSRSILSLLYGVAFLLLFFQPLILFDLSFQLSFLSLLSISCLVPPAMEIVLKRFPSLEKKAWKRGMLEILLASTAVQIGLFPLIVNQFHQVSLFALPANLILIPYFSFILMPLGMLGLLFSWIHPEVSVFFFQMAAFFAEGAIAGVKYLAALPGAVQYLPRLNVLQIILYVSIPLVMMSALRNRPKLILVCGLLIANGLAWFYPSWQTARRQDLRVHFLDVGQGDAILIQFPKGKNMLVDAGGLFGSSFDVGEKVVLPALLDLGVRNLDFLVLSHPHPDHYLGMKALLEAYAPQEFWWNGEMAPEADFQALLQALDAKGVQRVVKSRASSTMEISGAQIDFLHPHENLFLADKPDAATFNNHSLVMRIQDRGLSLLLSGDIQKEAEQEIVQASQAQNIDLLKVPHHGSDTSSTLEFVNHFKPRVAMIQAGRNNRFGFPKTSVLENYRLQNTKVLSTQKNGAVEFVWEGKELSTICEIDC